VTAIEMRSAAREDWPAIASLLEQLHLPLDGAADHLPAFIVATREGVVVGVGGLELHGESALLRSLAVATPGQGLGSRLVAALLEQARQRDVREVVLLTTSAATYFPRFGFVPVTREEVPQPLHASAEFQGACPASATVMRRDLRREELT
jgi:amino-acid N-acetyltransferase